MLNLNNFSKRAQQEERVNLLLNQSDNLGTARYGHIKTNEVINCFKEKGFFTSKVDIARKSKKAAFGRHIVRMRNEAFKIGNDFVEIVISNSYDCRSSLSISLGIFRLVCSNGMIVGENFFHIKATHNESIKNLVARSIGTVVAKIDDLKTTVTALKNRILTTSEINAIVMPLFKTRLDNIEKLQSIDLAASLVPQREADMALDAWTILNVVQEKLLRGGIEYAVTVERDGLSELKTQKSKATSSPSSNLKLNKLCFEAFTQLAA